MIILKNNPQMIHRIGPKKFFHIILNGLFIDNFAHQSCYNKKDLLKVLNGAVKTNEYIESFIRNNKGLPSADTFYRRLHHSSMHIDMLNKIIELEIKYAKGIGAFSTKIDVAIDEHDEPYYGKDNFYLTCSNKFKGTNKVLRFATIDALLNRERFTLGIIVRTPLDGMNRGKEVQILLDKAMKYVDISMVLLDRGYLSASVIYAINSKNLNYIIPAKVNSKTDKFKGLKKNIVNSNISYIAVKDKLYDTYSRIRVTSNYVYVKYIKDGKEENFSFYTNVEINDHNVIELAEKYRERWGIETGYAKKKELKMKSKSPNMKTRIYIYIITVILYNLWILLNFIIKQTRIGRYEITMVDFIYIIKKRFRGISKMLE